MQENTAQCMILNLIILESFSSFGPSASSKIASEADPFDTTFVSRVDNNAAEAVAEQKGTGEITARFEVSIA